MKKKRGRPTGTGEHQASLHLRINKYLLEAIDEDRGEQERSEWMRLAFEEFLAVRAERREEEG